MRAKSILHLICFASLAMYTQETLGDNEISIEDIVRSLQDQQARLEDLDVCYSTHRQFLIKPNWGTQKKDDGSD